MKCESVVNVHGLRMRYGDREAVRGVDLEIERGEIFALLGPNGAGKTTIVEILTGFRRPTAGEVRVLDADPPATGPEWRERVGVVLQESQPDPGLTARECLALYAGYFRTPRPPGEVAELVGLTGSLDVGTEQLSGGQRRRLDIGLALIGDPELLFLDEPTTGFDPKARRDAWDTIDGLRRLGTTIVLTTHAMDEAERLADRIAVIVDGAVVAQGTPGTIGGRNRRAHEISFTLPAGIGPAELPSTLRNGHGLSNRRISLRSTAPLADVRAISDWALARGVDLPDIEVRRPALEDVYLALAGSETTTGPQEA
ncbi:MAG TPA: ABC transporter ATP-binding protein [Gaiellales bacterium]|nr:ABC transporter ATP-binding protein [Gaiellales bacterium]